MILKLILKLWPALLPILTYLFWVVVVQNIMVRYLLNKIYGQKGKKKKSKIIDGEYEIIGDKSTKKSQEFDDFQEKSLKYHFSLKNKIFVGVVYLSLITAIFSLIYTALS